jgi:hypothetical protein
MSTKPSIEGLELEPCCVQALDDIRDKARLGKLLGAAIGGGLLITIFAGRGRTAQAGTAYNVMTTDWDLFARAAHAIPVIVRNRCQLIAALEVLNHSGGKLGQFWREMEESFN